MKTELLSRIARFLLISIISLNATALMAQKSEYKVFYYSGNPTFKSKNKVEKLVRDQVVEQSATISIPANSYVVLMNKDEVPVGLNKEGEYSIADIKKLYTNMGDSNLTEEFFAYIASSMLDTNDKNRRSGGVYRAVGDIMINPFDAANILDKKIEFEWNNSSGKQQYLKIFDIETWDMICNIPSTDSLYSLDVAEYNLQEGKEYAWIITHTSEIPQSGSELFVFTISDKQFKKDIDKKLKEANKKSKDVQMRKMLKLRVYIDSDIYPIPLYTDL